MSDRRRLKTASIDLKICGEVPHIMWTMTACKRTPKKRFCLMTGSNRRPFACKANVITNYTNET
eukprot:31265-Pelagococcus_subviridis.AAC.6